MAPLYVMRFSLFGLPSTFLEVSIIVTLLVWFGYKIAYDRRISLIPKQFVYVVTLIGISFLAATFVSDDVIGALGYLRAYFIEPVLFAYALYDVAQTIAGISIKQKTYRVAHMYWYALYFQAFWLACFGVLQVMFPQLVITAHQSGTAHAVFNTANALALVLGPIIAIRLYTYVTTRSTSLILCLIDLTLLLAFILTQSLGGILGFVAVVIS